MLKPLGVYDIILVYYKYITLYYKYIVFIISHNIALCYKICDTFNVYV